MKAIILSLMFSFTAFAVNCNKHPIYCQIKKNSPKIDKEHAMKVSNIIYKMHKKYHIPTRVFTAILRQESNYRLRASGCHRGLREMTDSEKLTVDVRCDSWKKRLSDEKDWIITQEKYDNECVPRYHKVETKICSDFGISQIYYGTANKFKINIELLTTDLAYSIEAGAIVLADFMKRYEARDNNWWVRYNCGTRGTTKRDTCQIYKKLVERYL